MRDVWYMRMRWTGSIFGHDRDGTCVRCPEWPSHVGWCVMFQKFIDFLRWVACFLPDSSDGFGVEPGYGSKRWLRLGGCCFCWIWRRIHDASYHTFFKTRPRFLKPARPSRIPDTGGCASSRAAWPQTALQTRMAHPEKVTLWVCINST